MRRQRWPEARPGWARAWFLTLTLAVLAGLAAMHGLGSTPPAAATTSPSATTVTAAGAVVRAHAGAASEHAMPAPAPAAVRQAVRQAEDCAHADATRVDDHGQGHGGGHTEHADPTCAAGGTGTGPVLPALPPSPVPAVADGAPVERDAVTAVGGRAPPSLSELQLLRI
ncbi:DUF6153 family protein [Streptomyces sp. P1-3]|uniref:DUF6153 family protein n=1 Tax=Streptomyces sp. P1-3 TaxID=3421658 RepID=UPI003D364D18